ncbi:MAG: hypothetical protein AB7G80_02335 [Dongiaceae bacterium]
MLIEHLKGISDNLIDVVYTQTNDPDLPVSTIGQTWILIDKNVLNHQASAELINKFPAQQTLVTSLSGGENIKSYDNWLKVMAEGYNYFPAKPPQRIIVVGGGTIANLGTYIAACFDPTKPEEGRYYIPPNKSYVKGAIPEFIMVPTNLVSISDVVIGSKGNLNHGDLKHAHKLYRDLTKAILDPRYITDLPSNKRKRGLSEIIKHALLQTRESVSEDRSAQLPPSLKDVCDYIFNDNPDPMKSFHLACQTMHAKEGILSMDKLERGWTSAVLNYGHLHAHALEMASHLTIPHDNSVYFGILMDLKLGGSQEIYKLVLKLAPFLPISDHSEQFRVDQTLLREAYAREPKAFFRTPDGRFKVLPVPKIGIYSRPHIDIAPTMPDPMQAIGLEEILKAYHEVVLEIEAQRFSSRVAVDLYKTRSYN